MLDKFKYNRVLKVLKKQYWTSIYSIANRFFSPRKEITEKNVVFIWIPKTGGTSMYHMLGQPPKLKSLKSIKESFRQNGIVTFGHLDFNELIEKGIIDSNFNKSSYKFTICRNPFDRAVSLFSYLEFIHKKESFLDFCYHIRSGVPEIGIYNRKGLSQCNSQLSWIKNLNIDFVVRFEEYKTYSKELFTEIGLPWIGVAHLNSSNHTSYKKFYCKESERIIREIYAEDFEYFGYSKKIG